MKILAIETSCDETAISVIEGHGEVHSPQFQILGNSLFSQVEIHKEFGGVFPDLARREHAKNLIPLLIKSLKEANLYRDRSDSTIDPIIKSKLEEVFNKEPQLLEQFLKVIPTIEAPEIDLIAVTEGPGLAPALWVGVNFAEGLRTIWNKPVLPVNHMEGHIWSVLLKDGNIHFPSLALLVSGGHTELVYIKDFGDFEVIGKTRDDAVGEAFDKVARLLELPYPGGPEISKLANNHRKSSEKSSFNFPMPMINSNDFDFSYSGLKTAVLYKLKEYKQLTTQNKEEIARAFEDAAIGVLMAKTEKALNTFEVKELIVGGGVISNTYLRNKLNELMSRYPDIILKMPERSLSTDNAVMIGISAWLDVKNNPDLVHNLNTTLQAKGNLSL